MIELRMHSMDVLAAFRVAALQAHRDGMPICAKRHEADAEALESALNSGDAVSIKVQDDRREFAKTAEELAILGHVRGECHNRRACYICELQDDNHSVRLTLKSIIEG